MNEWGQKGIPFLFIFDFELKKPVVHRLDRVPANILYNFNGRKNYLNGYSFDHKFLLDFIPLSKERFNQAFEKINEEILYGNTFLLNLSFKTTLNTCFDLKNIFYTSKARYKLYFKDEFIVFSPEIFVQIKSGKIFSYPMKGTIEANLQNAKERLINDEKELAEHFTIVDLIRNDLSQVAKNVKLERFRYVDLIKTNARKLYQTSSEISGDLPDHWKGQIGSILIKLLPAGSISGAPKKKTIDIIQKVEGEERGYYTGVCGIFDGNNLDSGVMIRYIEKQGNQLYYRSGGGITSNSDPILEYQEMLDKIYVPVV